jgi:ABC-type multidrug transport system ATPase subunit
MGFLIRAEGLGWRHSGGWLLRRVEFELRTGECLAVTGSNGTGKSTLLRLAAGLLEPSEGRVMRPGRAAAALLDASPYAELSPREHLALWRSLGHPGGDDMLNQVGLAAKADVPAGRLSSGQRVRLKIALALAQQPDCLILDEPTAALDDDGRRMIHQLVEEQTRRGAVLMATNDRRDLEAATHELPLAAAGAGHRG